MIYYPKSHITPNLYSNGNLSFKDTQNPYTGYYFAAVDGKNFTGRFPGDGNNLELIPTLDQSYPSVEEVEGHTPEDPRFYPKNATYSRINNVKYGKGITNPPTPFYPSPSNEDYKLGEFTRYFTKKVNNEFGNFANIYLVNSIYNVPKDEANTDYQNILEWVAYGNTIQEAD